MSSLSSSSSSEMEPGASEKWFAITRSLRMNQQNSNENESSENLPPTTETSSLTAIRQNTTTRSTMEIGENIPLSPQQDMKHHSNNSNETSTDDSDGDDENDEVEFLLTILPPSPQKTINQTMTTLDLAKSSSRSALLSGSFTPPQPEEESGNSTSNTANDTVSSTCNNASRPLHSDCKHLPTRTCPYGISNVSPASNKKLLHTRIDDNDDGQRVSSAASNENSESPFKTAGKSVWPPDHSYSMHRRSAYLQSLSEICHAVLWDARWRVGPEQERLLAWERGDDLSVVCTLAEQYIPINIPRALPAAEKQATGALQETPASEDEGKLEEPSISSAVGAPFSEIETTKETTDIQDDSDGLRYSVGEFQDDPHNRRLNLYCRLYYRKGPYFRVDDVFDKYYSPKRNKDEMIHSTASSPSSDPNAISGLRNSEPEPTKKDHHRDFFRPQKKKKTDRCTSPNSSNTIVDNNLLDIDMLHRRLDSACDLVRDWNALHDMGFLRTFADEEECGKTIGIKHGILKQDEQNQILKLLGCKKKIKSQKSPRNDQATNPDSPSGSENFIWNQMVHQTTISFATTPATARKGSIMPVMKHMSETILDSWAKSMVLESSKRDYMPTTSLRSLTMEVKTKLLNAIRAIAGGGFDAFSCCLRLREPPLNTLRRCSRLYLCATSGPGSMRGDDNTAWKSLPESHTKDLTRLPFQKEIPPPGSNCWNRVSCPGKDYRFKIRSCNFLRAHEPLDLKYDKRCGQKYNRELIQVFSTLEAFAVWELTIDLRANVDYLMMLKDLLRYNERKRSRQQDGDQDCQRNGSSAYEDIESVTVDFHDLLTRNGRAVMLGKLCVDMNPEDLGVAAILGNIEDDVEQLETGFAGGESSSKLPVECDKVLAVIAIVSMHTLAACSVHIGIERLLLYEKRPWLRHLCWEGCLAYILWDTIKTLECKLDGFYGLAVKALNVLLFGQAVMPFEVANSKMKNAKLMPLVLSRRAKGKAYERLALDYLHHLRQKRQKEQQKKDLETKKENEGRKETRGTTKRKAKDRANKDKPTPNKIVADLSQVLIELCVCRAQIPFSAVRTIARRLKRPLSKTMEGILSPETVELGHRYSNDSCASSTTSDTRYSDWMPTTDHVIANAMAADEDRAGKRCSYIGFEDNSINSRSLNVEELAMEFYRTGRLPVADPPIQKGGWVGWHDEGGKVRQLWRILSSPSVLGMDFGTIEDSQSLEMATIHLTPYQGAPFDLHCGTELDFDMVARRGFYERRKRSIDRLLNQIASMRPPEVADLVYSSVESRFLFAREHRDPTLRPDIEQVNGLSLLAAGIGGKLLSAIFRCFFYDYRHYSGGLPDLTLVRALANGNIVDLGEFVGEGFHPDKEDTWLEDRDNEFLGCSKVGDSGSRGINQMRRGQRRQERRGDPQNKDRMPPKLDLKWQGNPVTVECMFVEVKSANDRLDARQEDWLNILDIHGNARVCKFGAKKK